MSEDDRDDGDNLVTMTGSALGPRFNEALESDAQQVRDRVIELRDRMTEDYFEIGRLLYRIQKEGLYRLWKGPDGLKYERFSAYVEHEVSFKYRKAKYLMSIWWWFAEELKDPAILRKMRGIGWSKASILVGVVDASNVDAWVEKAQELSVKELESEARVALESAGRRRPTVEVNTSIGPGQVEGGRTVFDPTQPMPEKRPTPPAAEKDPDRAASVADETSDQQHQTNIDGTPRTTAVPHPAPLSGSPEKARQGVDPLSEGQVRLHRTMWRCVLDGEQKENVEKAIDVASSLAKVEADGKGYLLDLIATHFLATHSEISSGDDRQTMMRLREKVLRSAGRAFNLSIVALEKDTDRIAFGRDVLERVEMELEEDDAGES